MVGGPRGSWQRCTPAGIFEGMSYDASVTTRDENRLVVQWMETTNVSDVDNDLVPASPRGNVT